MRYSTISDSLSYIRDLFAPEDPALHSISNSLTANEKGMQIGPEEGKILFTLARMLKAKKIVEIGTLAGYSSIWMARALPEEGHLYAVEQDNRKFPMIRDNYTQCGVADKITLCEGSALEVLPKLEPHGLFDMVFIDADKASYCHYLDWAEQHVRKGGIIVGDNTFLFGTVYQKTRPENVSEHSWNAMKSFNQRLADPQKYSGILLPTAEGMTIAVKEF